jgi:hypothetical protein
MFLDWLIFTPFFYKFLTIEDSRFFSCKFHCLLLLSSYSIFSEKVKNNFNFFTNLCSYTIEKDQGIGKTIPSKYDTQL